MNMLIMGVGGLGGVFGAELIRAGYAPTLLTNNGVITQAINLRGLTLHTPDGETATVRGHAVTTATELPHDVRYDAVWLVTKATAALDAVRAAQPFLAPDGYMVAFQNGLVEDAIERELGESGRLLTSIVAFGGTMEAPGVYRRTTDGSIFVGELDGTVSPRVTALRDQLRNVVSTEISTDIHGLGWGKLCWNAMVNGLGAVAGYTFGQLTATAQTRDLILRGYTEVIDTARAAGIEPAPEVVGPTVALHTPPDADAAAVAERHAMLNQMAESYADVRPSSLQSLERGRPTETEYLNGVVVAKAAEHGVDVPLNRAIVRMIDEIENGDRDITPSNLAELARV